MSARPLFGMLAASGLLTAATLLGTTTAASAQATAPVTLSATGDGSQEVPAGSGQAGAKTAGSFQLTPAGALAYTVTSTGNTQPVTVGHLHSGVAGVNGPVVVPLDTAAIKAGTTTSTQIAPALAAEIIANPAGFYLNIHSADFAPPTGTARGQLSATTAAPTTINTGSGGQAAAQSAGSSDALVVGGVVALLAVATAGGIVVLRRRGVSSA